MILRFSSRLTYPPERAKSRCNTGAGGRAGWAGQAAWAAPVRTASRCRVASAGKFVNERQASSLACCGSSQMAATQSATLWSRSAGEGGAEG